MFSTPPPRLGTMVKNRSTSCQELEGGEHQAQESQKEEPKMIATTSVQSKSSKCYSAKVLALKKTLELKAAREKARIQMELIEKKLEADMAAVEVKYSPKVRVSQSNSQDIKKSLERSQYESERQETSKHGTNKGALLPPHVSGTDGPTQQLASALKDLTTSASTSHNNISSQMSKPKDSPLSFEGCMEDLSFKNAHVPTESAMDGPSKPCDTSTPLGWSVHDHMPRAHSSAPDHRSKPITPTDATASDACGDDDLYEPHDDVQLCSFMTPTEAATSRSRQEQRAGDHSEVTSSALVGGVHVSLPWRDYCRMITDSFPMAMSRLRNGNAKMCKNERYAEKDQERLQHLSKTTYTKELSTNEETNKAWYSSRFDMKKPNREKMRWIFDGGTMNQSAARVAVIVGSGVLLAALGWGNVSDAKILYIFIPT